MPRLAGYQAEQMQPLNQRILDALAALPGVRAVAATDDPDLAGDDETGNISVAGIKMDNDDMQVEEPWVTPTYFSTMQVPVLAGRAFNDQEGQDAIRCRGERQLREAILRQPANCAWPHDRRSTIRQNQVRYRDHRRGGRYQASSVRDPVACTVYRSLLQEPQLNGVTYLVRTWQQPADAEAGIRSAMQQLDSEAGGRAPADRGRADRQRPVH